MKTDRGSSTNPCQVSPCHQSAVKVTDDSIRVGKGVDKNVLRDEKHRHSHVCYNKVQQKVVYWSPVENIRALVKICRRSPVARRDLWVVPWHRGSPSHLYQNEGLKSRGAEILRFARQAKRTPQGCAHFFPESLLLSLPKGLDPPLLSYSNSNNI